MPRKTKTESQQARQFALILPVLLGVLASIAWWRGHTTLSMALLTPVPLVLLLAFALPNVWLGAFRRWMQFALVLSWVMTRVILTVFFIVVLTPFGLVMRLIGKRPLNLTWKDGKSTYWIDRAPGEYTIERYGKQF